MATSTRTSPRRRGAYDGPALVAWMHARDPTFYAPLTATQKQAVRRWERGMQAQVATVISVLHAVGWTVDDVPAALRRPYVNGRLGLSGGRGRTPESSRQ